MTTQRVDAWGRVILTEPGLLELFYQGVDIQPDLIADDNQKINDYNVWCDTFDHPEDRLVVYSQLDVTPEIFHTQRQDEWLIPEKYKQLDLESYLFAKCTTTQQIDRVKLELALYVKHRMVGVLRLMAYIVDALMENNVLWGVGRGSSVASYILYLIGVHRIDSIKYGLDIGEFIK